MKVNPGWLLLLSVCAGVSSVPINVANQEVKEEAQEENGVKAGVLRSIRRSLRDSLV